MTEWSAVIRGEPVAKGRPRHTKTGVTYTPARTRRAAYEFALLCRAAGLERFDGPVHLTVHYNVSTRRRLDLDNLLKQTLDSLIGVAWRDDQQVEAITASILRAAPTAETRITIQPIMGYLFVPAPPPEEDR